MWATAGQDNSNAYVRWCFWGGSWDEGAGRLIIRGQMLLLGRVEWLYGVQAVNYKADKVVAWDVAGRFLMDGRGPGTGMDKG